eukprot:5210810-Pleurochrysis_carterae.AAC.4
MDDGNQRFWRGSCPAPSLFEYGCVGRVGQALGRRDDRDGVALAGMVRFQPVRRLCSAAIQAPAERPELSVRQRLKQISVDPELLRRIQKLGLGRAGTRLLPHASQLRQLGDRVLGRVSLIKSGKSVAELPKSITAELALAGSGSHAPCLIRLLPCLMLHKRMDHGSTTLCYAEP